MPPIQKASAIAMGLTLWASACASGGVGATSASTASAWDEPQPQCFLGDAMAAGTRMGQEGLPNEAEQFNHPTPIKGGMDRTGVTSVVEGHVEEVRYCYAKALAANPKLGGNVVVRFTVGAQGRVITSAIASSTVNDEGVESCVARAVCRWAFEAPSGGAKVVINYPFALNQTTPTSSR